MSGKGKITVLAKHFESVSMPGRKVAPTTTFVLYLDFARLV
jgi:hypothetical protein